MSDGADSEADEGSGSSEMERTPRDARRDGPAPPGSEYKPAGPPRPLPVHGPMPDYVQPDRNDDAEALETSRKRGMDNEDPRPPMRARAAETPGAKPAPPPSPRSSTSSDHESSEMADLSDHAAPDRADPDRHPDGDSDQGWWSDTSLTLTGPALATARDHLCTIYRKHLLDVEPDIGTRSLAGRVGALRRRIADLRWEDIQGLASQRLEGQSMRERSTFEFRATHQYHRGDTDDSAD